LGPGSENRSRFFILARGQPALAHGHGLEPSIIYRSSGTSGSAGSSGSAGAAGAAGGSGRTGSSGSPRFPRKSINEKASPPRGGGEGP